MYNVQRLTCGGRGINISY